MQAAGVVGVWAVGGAVGAIFHTEPFSTNDLDVLVAFEGGSLLDPLRPLIEHLAARGFTNFEREGLVIGEWPVQFLPVADALDAEALAEAVSADFGTADDPAPARVLRVEHLIAIALRVGRPKDQARVVHLLEASGLEMPRLMGVLERHGLTERWHAFAQRFNLDPNNPRSATGHDADPLSPL